MNSLDVPSLGSKTLMGLIPVTIGSLFLYCMNTSKKKKLEEALEYPPVAPVGTLQWIKARSCPDYPLQFLQWCRDMDSPVYRLKTLLYDMVLTDDIHLFRQILKDKEKSGSARVVKSRSKFSSKLRKKTSGTTILFIRYIAKERGHVLFHQIAHGI